MDTSTIVTVGIIMVLIITVALFSIKNGNKSKAEQAKSKSDMYRKVYRFISRNFITQGTVMSIYKRLANLSIYRKEELMENTTKYFMISWGVGGALIIASFFLFGDTLSILMCIMFALLISKVLVDKQIDKVHMKVVHALSKALGSVRQEYMRLNSVVEAINEADIDDILKKPFDEIYTILTASDGEFRLQEFYEASPFRTLQTFASISYSINNQGDEKDASGQSNYVQALTLMSSDVNSEIERMVNLKKRFGFIEYLPFIPVFATGFVESYFIGIMPGTAVIYGGPIGYLCRTITMVLSIVAYSVISSINSAVPIKEDDRGSWVLSLLEKPQWKKFISQIEAKNRKAYFLKRKLRDALSKMEIEHFYTKKVVYLLACLLFALVASVSINELGKEFLKTNTQQMSLVASSEMDAYSKEQIQTLDNRYIYADPEPSEEELTQWVKSAMPSLTDLQVIDQVKRIQDKKKNIFNTYYKWWYIWICFAISWVGWFAPNLLLMLRKMLVKTEAEDDFLQLQTLISILMNTNMDTMDTLYQLMQNSRIHKDMLSYCFHSYPSNPELELARLQSKTPLVEFKRFIGKLKLTISDLSLREAFSDLIIEREHMLRMREMSIEATINKKRGLCGPLSLVPMGAMVISELLIPLGYLGIMEFMNALTMM